VFDLAACRLVDEVAGSAAGDSEAKQCPAEPAARYKVRTSVSVLLITHGSIRMVVWHNFGSFQG
jgi:hypothetical protein